MINRKHALLGTSLAIFAGIIWFSNPISLAGVIAKTDKFLVLYAFLAANVSLFLRVVKWKVLTNLSFSEILPVQILGMAIGNFTPGKIAEPVKAVVMKARTGVAVSTLLPSIAWERVLDVVVLLLLSIISLHIISVQSRFFLASSIVIAVFSVLVVAALLVIYRKSFGLKIFNILNRFPIFRKIGTDFIETFYKKRLPKRNILYSFVVTAAAWMIDGLVVYFILLSLGTESSPLLLSGIVALSILIGIASSLPGGIGSSEFIMILLLGIVGIEPQISVAVTLVSRFITFWYPAFLGWLSIVYLGKRIDVSSIKLFSA